MQANFLNSGDLFGFENAFLVLSLERSDQKNYKWTGVAFQSCIPINKWAKLDYEVAIPSEIRAGDVIKTYIWSKSPDDIYLHTLELNLIKVN